jgi:hypothetical protein
MSWACTPYNIRDGNIQWLQDPKSPGQTRLHDAKAQMEHDRCVDLVHPVVFEPMLTKVKNADGFIDLTKIQYLRTVKRKVYSQTMQSPEGESLDSRVAELSTNESEYAFEQGSAAELDDERTFELVLENGLVVRLQSYNMELRREWMRRLRDLVKYWKLRLAEDIASLKEMRERNLRTIRIDPGNESGFDDWIQKYQLIDSVSAPEMYHFCRVASCRTISVRVSATAM